MRAHPSGQPVKLHSLRLAFAPAEGHQARGEMPARLWVPRIVGLALGGLCVGAGLAQQGAVPVVWLLLALHALAWPHLALRLAARSPDPAQAEVRNLLIDTGLGGFWVAAMGLNLLPSVLITTMLAMNNMAVGGFALFGRGLAVQAVGVAAGWALLTPSFEPSATAATQLACLPFLIVYPLTIGWINHRLSAGLVRKGRALAESQQQYRAMLDAMDAGVALWDADGRLMLCNEEFRRIHAPVEAMLEPGTRFEDVLRAAMARGLVPEAVGREEDWLRERMRQHRRPGAAINRRFPGDRWRRIVEQRLPDGSVLAFSTDITEVIRKKQALERAQAEAEQARARLQDALDVLPDGFALYDADDRLVVCNRKYREIYAESAPHILPGRTFEDLLRYGIAHGQYPDAIGREEAWLAERLHRHRNPTGAITQEVPGNRWLRINESKTREGGYAGVRVDVTDLVRREQELKRLNAERDEYARQLHEANQVLERLSETDGLTGLANRRLFDRRLEEEWQRARRHGTPLSVLMLDVDHFKQLNDGLGHLAGDECLRRIAEALKTCAMRSGELVARYGGEEFAVLLPQTTLDEAMAVAQRCLGAVDAAAIAHPESPTAGHVTVSIGVGCCARLGQDADALALVRQADQALYRAKSLGRHCVQVIPD